MQDLTPFLAVIGIGVSATGDLGEYTVLSSGIGYDFGPDVYAGWTKFNKVYSYDELPAVFPRPERIRGQYEEAIKVIGG